MIDVINNLVIMYINKNVTKLYQYSKLKITTTLFSSYCIFCTFFFWSLLLAGTIMHFFSKQNRTSSNKIVYILTKRSNVWLQVTQKSRLIFSNTHRHPTSKQIRIWVKIGIELSNCISDSLLTLTSKLMLLWKIGNINNSLSSEQQ